jgi:Short-chain dehydrogenases of various substrate specificities
MKALITGASSGIGRDIAKLLAARGYDLILVARRENLLVELKAELSGVDVTVVPADLTEEDACRSLYERFRNEPVEVLVNNAGFGLVGAFDKTELNTELDMIDLNIRAVHILTKLFLVDFKHKNKGYILNVASSAGFIPGPLMSTYYASKAYVLWLTQAIWKELRMDGSAVKISALCPGPVPTDFNRRAKVKNITGKGLPSRYVAEYGLNGMFRGKRTVIPGAGMRFALTLQKFMPMRALLAFAYKRMTHKGVAD